jgi:hypothetical protein
MPRPRATGAAAPACILALLAGCEQPITPAPALAPSPAVHTTTAPVAVGAPTADVQRASAAWAGMVSEWDRPSAHGSARKSAQAGPMIDAAALAAATAPENLPDAARALDRLLRATTPGKPAPR